MSSPEHSRPAEACRLLAIDEAVCVRHGDAIEKARKRDEIRVNSARLAACLRSLLSRLLRLLQRKMADDLYGAAKLAHEQQLTDRRRALADSRMSAEC